MKLSIESYVMRHRFGDVKAIEMISKAGFDALDYSYYWVEDDSPILGDEYIDYAKKIRECIDRNNIVCNQAHAPIDRLKYGMRFDMSEPYYKEIVRAIESAGILGAKSIVVHAIQIPREIEDVDFETYNLEFYKSLEPYCEKAGIKIAVENLFSYDAKRDCNWGVLATPELLCGFIKKLNSPNFVACIDVGHAALTGLEPEKFISNMIPVCLQALHIQDTDYLRDRHIVPFMGNINWSAVMSALKKINYEGELTFEVFCYLNNLPDELVSSALEYIVDIGKYLKSLY